MIVLRSTYDRLNLEFFGLQYKYAALLAQWNSLVEEINNKGGKTFLKGTTTRQLSNEDIKRLLMLVHPDKHDGKPVAVEMTQKLLSLRDAK